LAGTSSLGGLQPVDLDEDIGDLGDLRAVTVPAIHIDRVRPRPRWK